MERKNAGQKEREGKLSHPLGAAGEQQPEGKGVVFIGGDGRAPGVGTSACASQNYSSVTYALQLAIFDTRMRLDVTSVGDG